MSNSHVDPAAESNRIQNEHEEEKRRSADVKQQARNT